MCAILDADVAYEVFGDDRPASGKERPASGRGFFNWIDSGKGKLLIGGQLLDELSKSRRFKEWLLQARRAGRVIVLDRSQVDKAADTIKKAGSCRSNDQHIIALAQISGARLLYSNDGKLRSDFKNRNLVDGPPGKIYSTKRNRQFTKAHKRLLGQRNICSG